MEWDEEGGAERVAGRARLRVRVREAKDEH